MSIPEFAQISGGRSSGMMAGLLRDTGCHFIFQNTGREREETYQYLKDMQDNWGINIIWLEYMPTKPWFKVVDFDTADRTGLPFAQLISKKKRVPNRDQRFCTEELKVLTARRYIRSLGHKQWVKLVGFRADEPTRVADLLARPVGKRVKEYGRAPLAERGITAKDVGEFWRAQPFDLKLPLLPNGKTVGGNCKGCFQHSEYQHAMLVRNAPADVAWLIEQEQKVGGTFNKNHSWSEFADHVHRTRVLIEHDPLEAELYCQDSHGSCGV